MLVSVLKRALVIPAILIGLSFLSLLFSFVKSNLAFAAVVYTGLGLVIGYYTVLDEFDSLPGVLKGFLVSMFLWLPLAVYYGVKKK